MKTPWLKRALIGAAVTAALAGSLTAYSQSSEGHWHGGPPAAEDMATHQAMMLAHIGQKLSLDANQKALLQALADQLKAQHTALMTNGGDPHTAVKALIAGNTFDRAGAQALVNAKIAQMQTSAPPLITAVGTFYDSLSAEQQQKVRDFIADHHARMGHGASAPADH